MALVVSFVVSLRISSPLLTPPRITNSAVEVDLRETDREGQKIANGCGTLLETFSLVNRKMASGEVIHKAATASSPAVSL